MSMDNVLKFPSNDLAKFRQVQNELQALSDAIAELSVNPSPAPPSQEQTRYAAPPLAGEDQQSQ
jgi:hypothetical protein